ncbi:uncharacterized protein EV420DRAFT_1538195 [Desarmillaria tabescens]|uniref:G-patch domain-containing protein n=1 Tax=Armillaria tabescens TaxID=1929756 RepID=A0AA39KE09_ARMTA|nr:uncharacterized protein EV420DRAFT_1538195 [Desarmillaria tabescens]KAK0459083.1 hypothetical protein EV420DRAFT_1538195 [Desarmillaria tabescens]
MGLSGRKVKQRISADPRNLSWADDASKFGATYLSKFGWSSSQGLGVSGEGRTSHIKVSQKLDMMGIGAAHQKDPNGIAWKQNKDFENVLMRLNASQGSVEVVEEQFALGGQFISETKIADDGGTDEKETKKKEKKEKKRKREEKGNEEGKKKTKKTKLHEAESSDVVEESVVPAAKPQTQRALPRHRAHRARAIAAKNRATTSDAAMSEILGISQSATPQPSTPAETEELPTLETLTVSTKSVADYFKERLLSKSGKSTPAERIDEENEASLGGIGSGSSRAGKSTPAELESSSRTDDDDLPRGGIGSFNAQRTSGGDDAPPRIGIGMSKFSSLISSSFLAATSTSMLSSTPLDGDGEAQSESMRTVKEKKRKDKQDKQDGDKKGVRKMEMQSEGDDDKKAEKKRRKEAKKRKQEEQEGDVGPTLDAAESADKKSEKKRRKQTKEELEDGGPAPENGPEVKLSKEERKREKKEKKRRKLESQTS